MYDMYLYCTYILSNQKQEESFFFFEQGMPGSIFFRQVKCFKVINKVVFSSILFNFNKHPYYKLYQQSLPPSSQLLNLEILSTLKPELMSTNLSPAAKVQLEVVALMAAITVQTAWQLER